MPYKLQQREYAVRLFVAHFWSNRQGWLWGWGNHESMFLVNGWLLLSLDVIFHLDIITVALAVKTNSKAHCPSIHILFIGLVWENCYKQETFCFKYCVCNTMNVLLISHAASCRD